MYNFKKIIFWTKNLGFDTVCDGFYSVIKSFLGKCPRLPAIDVPFFPGMFPFGSTLSRNSAL